MWQGAGAGWKGFLARDIYTPRSQVADFGLSMKCSIRKQTKPAPSSLRAHTSPRAALVTHPGSSSFCPGEPRPPPAAAPARPPQRSGGCPTQPARPPPTHERDWSLRCAQLGTKPLQRGRQGQVGRFGGCWFGFFRQLFARR